jgi:hypothetical protein
MGWGEWDIAFSSRSIDNSKAEVLVNRITPEQNCSLTKTPIEYSIPAAKLLPSRLLFPFLGSGFRSYIGLY